MCWCVLQSELEDAVFIWCAEGSTHSSSSSSSSSSGPFVLDCLLPLEDTAASLAWLDTGGLPPLLAVGVACGLVEVYCRDRRYGGTALGVVLQAYCRAYCLGVAVQRLVHRQHCRRLRGHGQANHYVCLITHYSIKAMIPSHG
jgi:hypothetical protein